MGILDDAIREHLELKRAHGAAEEDVLRQEAEALGPARREPPAATSFEPSGAEPMGAPPDPGAAVGFDDGAPPPPVVDQDTEMMPAAELPVPDDDPLALPSEPPPALTADEVPLHDQLAPEPEPEYSPEPVFDAEAPAPEPEPEPRASIDDAETRMRPLPPLDDDLMPPEPARPVEHDEPEPEPEAAMPPPFEDRPAEPAPATSEDGEDLLEETPDFLQETPEHDRLWFEQKPPRDFDFDD